LKEKGFKDKFSFYVMGKNLSIDQQRIFRDISWAIGDEIWHPLSDISGVGTPKSDIPKWMAFFEDQNFYKSRESEKEREYMITGKGLRLFDRIRDKDYRDSQPVPFRYPQGFKAIKPQSVSNFLKQKKN